MSSSPNNIKTTSLIRKFRNSLQNSSLSPNSYKDNPIDNKKKPICDNYSYNISSDYEGDINTANIFNSKNKELFSGCVVPAQATTTHNDIKKSEYINIPISKSNNVIDVNEYINTSNSNGFLSSAYNAELVDENWIISMFYLYEIHTYYKDCNTYSNSYNSYKIKTLFIDISWPVLSAFHHFTNNCEDNVDWNYLTTVPGNTGISNMPKLINTLKRKYNKHLISLLDNNVYSANNINFLINETSNKLDKINMLMTNSINSTNDYITYIALSIKIMEPHGCLFMRIPNIKECSIGMINVIILCELCFENVYIYNFDILNKSTYLLCKTKKKINNEIIYKKLISLLSNKDFDDNYNIFATDFLNNILERDMQKITDIINMNLYEISYLSFNSVFNKINKILNINIHTFT